MACYRRETAGLEFGPEHGHPWMVLDDLPKPTDLKVARRGAAGGHCLCWPGCMWGGWSGAVGGSAGSDALTVGLVGCSLVVGGFGSWWRGCAAGPGVGRTVS